MTDQTVTVTVTLPVTDRTCADIFCTALEGGIGYWAQADKITKRAAPNPSYSGEEDYVSCVLAELNDDESDYDWDKPLKLDYSVIRKGIATCLSPGFKLRSDLKAQVATAFNEEDCDIDADAADCIVQAGLFGEIRYG